MSYRIRPMDLSGLRTVSMKLDLGNTVPVIEHNMDMVKSADSVIDLGPDGGEDGGRIVAVGTPEQVMGSKKSFTGVALKKVMG